MFDASIAPICLYSIDECPDLMSDACVCDETNQLVFLSLWGRDTAVQQFLARLQVGSAEAGLDGFHLVTDDRTSIPVAVGDVDRLQKRTTRSFQRTLFGSLIHLWLIDSRCIKPDRPNASALAILPKEDARRTTRLWSLVQDTCPLPLLEPWRDTVLELLRSQNMLSQLAFAVGPVEGYRIRLDVPVLTEALGALIRTRVLDIHLPS